MLRADRGEHGARTRSPSGGSRRSRSTRPASADLVPARSQHSPHEKFLAAHIPATLLLRDAFAGKEVSSEIYAAHDLTPAMDVCVPARARPLHTVCASLDLLELQRLVQRIQIGESGQAVALDPVGHVIAAGAGELRAAALTGEPVPESSIAMQLMRGVAPPEIFVNALGKEVLAGWSQLQGQSWIIVVEEPVREALAPANQAMVALLIALFIALVASLTVGLPIFAAGARLPRSGRALAHRRAGSPPASRTVISPSPARDLATDRGARARRCPIRSTSR